jgi:hypothetical protein
VASEKYSASDTSRLVHVTNAEGQENGNHIRSFNYVSEKLGEPAFMKTAFKAQAERAMVYAAMAQFKRERGPNAAAKRRGHYQVFGCDFILDAERRAHLLECNGAPFERGPELMWEEMVALVLNLHAEPWRLLRHAKGPGKRQGVWADGPKSSGDGGKQQRQAVLVKGFTFGGWSCIYNELETSLDSYNPCT